MPSKLMNFAGNESRWRLSLSFLDLVTLFNQHPLRAGGYTPLTPTRHLDAPRSAEICVVRGNRSLFFL